MTLLLNTSPVTNSPVVSSVLTYDQAWDLVGGFSSPSKMPCYSWSISARDCRTGSKLRKIADSVCSKCYAMKGNYNFPCVVNAHTKRLNAVKGPRFVEAFVYLIKCLDQKHFRLFDSGDLQSTSMLRKFVEIARECPEVEFWMPTKEYKIVTSYLASGGIIPNNLTIRLSGYMIDADGPVAIAKKNGLVISEVRTVGYNCPSSTTGNKCATCRACWDKKTFNVVYKRH